MVEEDEELAQWEDIYFEYAQVNSELEDIVES